MLAACAGGPRPGASTRQEDPNLVTTEELRTAFTINLYDFLRSRRPMWFSRARPSTILPGSEPGVTVFLDNIRFGNILSLRQLTTASVTAVRFYGRTSAEAQFGPGYLGGVIQVVTRLP